MSLGWRRGMAQNIVTTDRIDAMVDAWIKEGRFANRSEAFRAGIFALKEKVEAEAFDPDYVTIVRELDRHPGGGRAIPCSIARSPGGWRGAARATGRSCPTIVQAFEKGSAYPEGGNSHATACRPCRR